MGFTPGSRTATVSLRPDRTGRRARRVVVLLVGILVLSVADFVVTLAYLRGTGMLEANPIAAWLVRSTQSPWALAAYKGATVTLCITLLYCLRRHKSSEIASWCAIVILAAMSLMWHSYCKELESPAEIVLVQAENPGTWLRID